MSRTSSGSSTGAVARGDVKKDARFVGTAGMDELRNRGSRLPFGVEEAVVVVDNRSPLLLPLLPPLLLRRLPPPSRWGERGAAAAAVVDSGGDIGDLTDAVDNKKPT